MYRVREESELSQRYLKNNKEEIPHHRNKKNYLKCTWTYKDTLFQKVLIKLMKLFILRKTSNRKQSKQFNIKIP